MGRCHFQPGDEGRPVTADNLLIGVARRGWVTSPDLLSGGWQYSRRPMLVLFSAILGDVNAKGGPGAGLSPISCLTPSKRRKHGLATAPGD